MSWLIIEQKHHDLRNTSSQRERSRGNQRGSTSYERVMLFRSRCTVLDYWKNLAVLELENCLSVNVNEMFIRTGSDGLRPGKGYLGVIFQTDLTARKNV